MTDIIGKAIDGIVKMIHFAFWICFTTSVSLIGGLEDVFPYLMKNWSARSVGEKRCEDGAKRSQ